MASYSSIPAPHTLKDRFTREAGRYGQSSVGFLETLLSAWDKLTPEQRLEAIEREPSAGEPHRESA